LLPSFGADYHAVADQTLVGHKLRESNQPVGPVERGVINTIDEIAGLLKFAGEEISGGDVDSFGLDTSGVRAASVDLIRPETQAGGVGLAS
jgi:hypothetical protein